jgi:hypothetical protein
MLSPNARRGLALASALSCLACVVWSRPARADGVLDSVRIDANDDAEVFRRTDEVASVPVRVGRFGTRMARAPVYAPVCVRTPCETKLADGRYYLALSEPGGEVVESDTPVDLQGDASVHGTYTDRSLLRGIGILTLIVAPLAGTGLFFVGSHAGASQLQINPGSAVAGTTVLVAGLAASLVLALQADSVSFSIGPYALGSPPGMRESGWSSARPQGLELTMHF